MWLVLEWDESQQPSVILQGQLNTGYQQVKLELAIKDSQATLLNIVSCTVAYSPLTKCC